MLSFANLKYFSLNAYLCLCEIEHASRVFPAECLGPALRDGGALVDRVLGEVASACLAHDRLWGSNDGGHNRHQGGVALHRRDNGATLLDPCPLYAQACISYKRHWGNSTSVISAKIMVFD